MEGISHEACSLAGSMKLGKLIAFYDDNNISIDGEVRGHGDTPGWFLDNTPKRFEAYGWHVIPKVDGHDPEAIKKAIEEARKVTDKPTIICCQTIIGFGSPNKQGKEECHGAALGNDEIALTRENLGWKHAPFEIPGDIYEGWDAKEIGAKVEGDWNDRFENYRREFPELATEFERRMSGELPKDWAEKSAAFVAKVNEKGETIASRKASQNTLNGFGPLLPELLGGSADLAGSNLTLWSGCKDVNAPGHDGNYVYYGVREFGMSAIMNGVAVHGGFIPYGATFLMFSEYARNAIRMAALMKAPVIYVYTHDSIGLGEDGPTHQPVEQTATLRMVPNLHVWRPSDAVESAVCWKAAVDRKDGPSCLIFSRQNLPHVSRSAEQIAGIGKGGYVLRDCAGTPDAIIIATGSEVELAVKAQEALAEKGKNVRVVSVPSTNVFDAQSQAYRDSVLPPAVKCRVAVEAGVSDGWYKYVGFDGKVIGLDRFGESAPAGELFKEFGFTVENVVKTVEGLF
jgi:transketolase